MFEPFDSGDECPCSAPDVIYLQWFGQQEGATWCEDRINDEDVMYRRTARLADATASQNETCMDAIVENERLRAVVRAAILAINALLDGLVGLKASGIEL